MDEKLLPAQSSVEAKNEQRQNSSFETKIAALETKIFGAPTHSGGILPRVTALEEALLGATSSGSLPDRIAQLEFNIQGAGAVQVVAQQGGYVPAQPQHPYPPAVQPGIPTAGPANIQEGQNEWSHGAFACCDDGCAACLFQMGICAICAAGRQLEMNDDGSCMMWSLIGHCVPYIGAAIVGWKSRTSAIQKYGIKENTMMTIVCVCCNPCGRYQPLMEHQDKEGGKFGKFGKWEPGSVQAAAPGATQM